MTPDTEPSDGAKLATIFMVGAMGCGWWLVKVGAVVLAIYLLWRIAA